MTPLAEPIASQRDRRRRLARAWASPLWAHLVALALVLVALLAVIGTTSSFSADEGAAIVQARSLESGGGWLVEHPVPQVDPAGANYPMEFSSRGALGWAPYAKHPLYPLLLAGAAGIGGVTAMVLLSLAGTVAAAGLAGSLAGKLDPALSRVALWTVGIASPIFFDGYLVIAHTLGAALAAAGVLAGIVAVERRSWAWALLVAPAIAVCVLLRSEGLFIATALAAAAGVIALRRPDVRGPAATVALVSFVAGVGALLADRRWGAGLVGSAEAGPPAPLPAGSGGLLDGRVKGFLLTWLTPSYSGRPLLGLLLLTMLAALVVGAVTARRSPSSAGRIVGSAAVAAGAALAALAVGPGNVVPGLLLAFPLAVVGLMMTGRRTVRTDAARVASAVSVLFVLAVAGTQYAKGGGGEWGGRYFALAIPIAVPVLLLALRDGRAALAPAVSRRAGVAVIVCSLAMTTMGVTALRSSHRANASLVETVDRVGSTLDGDRPILVTTEGAMPRFAWPTYDRQRWLLAGPEGIDDLLDRLSAAGISRIGFVTRNLDRDQGVLERAGAGVVSIDTSQSARRWHVLVLQLDQR